MILLRDNMEIKFSSTSYIFNWKLTEALPKHLAPVHHSHTTGDLCLPHSKEKESSMD